MIFKSPLPDVTIPKIALTPFVLEKAARLSDKVAIVEAGSGRSYTYGQLAAGVKRLAAGLSTRGFHKGDVLAIMSPNLPEYPIAFHGVATAGGINTTLNPTYTADEIAFQLNDSRARLLVTIPPLVEKAKEAAAKSMVEEIIVFGEAEGAVPFESLLVDGLPPNVEIDPAEDLVALPYSSGTTGFSKGVMLTHRNLVANLVQSAQCIEVAEDEKLMAFLPFFHIYGMTVIMNAGLRHGATLVTMPRFELEPCLKAVQEYRVTRFFLVPPIVVALAKSPVVENYDLSSIKRAFSGAAPLDAETASAVSRRIGCRLSQGYGLTETSPVSHCVPDSYPEVVAGSVGPSVPNTECKIVDLATGKELGRNQDGEIWIRGPQVMKGYLNNPDATRASIDADGFFHSGDIGHIDDHDEYFIVDRLKELIKYKGFQVAPAELEALLLSHPMVADVAVIGVLDEEGEEIPKAFVVLKQPVAPEELMEFVASRVAPHKKVRRVEIVEQIPKSPTGKILRRVLRDREKAAGR
ncbi:MAG TPA: 4-coumarate--CoA ligase family protein [Candidatus Dormibacteraeota bacterium]|nr:4-coumarate--CoA ligase family protein [Candidatus Dormibacteraeota bacterium]